MVDMDSVDIVIFLKLILVLHASQPWYHKTVYLHFKNRVNGKLSTVFHSNFQNSKPESLEKRKTERYAAFK